MNFFTAFPDDWLSGTADLSCEESGAFWNIVCFYMLKDGQVPDDPSLLARICKLSKQRWRRVRETLIDGGFIEVRDGFIWQAKCAERLKKDGEFSRKQRENIKKRWQLKRAKGLKNNNTADTFPSPSLNKKKNTPLTPLFAVVQNDEKSPVSTGDSFDKFWDEYPSRRLHSNPKKTARAKFDAAVRNGVDPAAIIRGAKNYARYVQREGTDARYTAQAMTWLNQDRWEQYQQESTSNGNAAKARGNFL